MAAKFGTSGLRGLVVELTDEVVADHVAAFLRAVGPAPGLLIGRDLRASSPALSLVVAAAARGAGVRPLDLGVLPTPALALAAGAAGWPAVMVTGSHIPADRNGLKFYSALGEITKAEEVAITEGARSVRAARPDGPFPDDGGAVRRAYLDRYAGFFGPGALSGLRIGVYQQSTVARDLLVDLLTALGAEPVPLARSEVFIPVDTEAVSAEMRGQLGGWAALGFDAILSADGDADRPMVADERGALVPGDLLGLLTARALGAHAVVTPVSSTTAIEASGAFPTVVRTKIGSPHVIAGMATAGPRAVGFEANGGFLLGFEARHGGQRLAALPTRDAFLPMLMPLVEARAAGRPLSALLAGLPRRATASDRIEGVPTERSQALVATLSADANARAAFFAPFGAEAALDLTDGLRVTFADGLILHLRPSGNAPELRCYAEAGTEAEARAALTACLARARDHLAG